MRLAPLVLTALTLTTACKEQSSSGGVANDPSAKPLPSATIAALPPPSTPDPSAIPTPTAAATTTTTTTTTATATATMPTPTPTPSTAPTPTPSTAPTPSAAPPPPPAKPVFAHFAGSAYAVDLSNPGNCQSGTECTVVIRLSAQAPYHINKEYPYKFTANDAGGVQFVAADRVFSRGSGAFSQQGETAATITVRFRGTAAGSATIAGPFRLSVCTDKECKIDVANVSLTVPIL